MTELNWLPFLNGIDFETGVDQLVEVLDTDIDRVHLYTRLLTQAREWEPATATAACCCAVPS